MVCPSGESAASVKFLVLGLDLTLASPLVGLCSKPSPSITSWSKTAGACWYRKYAPRDTVLEGLERDTREAKKGLWADQQPVPPWEWRNSKTLAHGFNSGAAFCFELPCPGFWLLSCFLMDSSSCLRVSTS